MNAIIMIATENVFPGDVTMPDILVRGLDAEKIKRLKARARQNGRSLQSEARRLLEQAVDVGTDQIDAVLDRWKKQFAGRKFSGSAKLIREDRRR
jgi:plasmid stability protein